MKKLVLILVLMVFVAFSALTVQHVLAFSTRVEMVKFDKDPKKASEKKVAESKEIKTTDAKTADTDAKATTSTYSDKSSTSSGCCDHDKGNCCSSSPDKK